MRRLLVAGVAVLGLAGCQDTESPSAPTVELSISPEGQVIAGATVVVFTVAAADASAGALDVSWEFGDGQTASGPSVTHVYANEGVFAVGVTVSSDRGGSTTTGGAVTVGSLRGHWLLSEGGWRFYEVGFHISQSGPSLYGQPYSVPNRGCIGDLFGRVTSPRSVHFEFDACDGDPVYIDGTASPDLRLITGTYLHLDDPPYPIVLTRQ